MLSIKRFKPKTIIKKVRKLGKVTDDEWTKEFNTENVPLTDKLDTLVDSFGNELCCVLDILTPEKECKISLKPKQLWFDDEAKTLKRKMCKLEKKWLKYKLESCWMAYKKAWNSYYGLLLQEEGYNKVQNLKLSTGFKKAPCPGDKSYL